VAFDVAEFEAVFDEMLFAGADRARWEELRAQVKELAREVGRLGQAQVDLGRERLRDAEKRLDELARIVHDQGSGMTALNLEVAQLQRLAAAIAQVPAGGAESAGVPGPVPHWESCVVTRVTNGWIVHSETSPFEPSYVFPEWAGTVDFMRRALERGG
jgi:hypothetical protein